MGDLINDDTYYLVVAENENDPNDGSSNEIILNVFGLNDQESTSSNEKENLTSSFLNDVYKLITANMTVKQKTEEWEKDLNFDGGNDEEFKIRNVIKLKEKKIKELSEMEDFQEDGISSYEEEGEVDELLTICLENENENDIMKLYKATLLDNEKRGSYGRLVVPVCSSEQDGASELPHYLDDEEGNYKCKFCNHSTNNERAAAKHYRNKHRLWIYKCLACGLGFRRNNYLLKHETKCSSQYAPLLRKARASITQRRLRPDRAVLVPCNECGKLIRKSNMALHLRVHSELQTYDCTLCPASFRSRIPLLAHMRAHSGLRPYQCEQCPRAYTSRASLHKHRVTHGAASFFCDHCGRGFVRKDALTVHIKTHDGGTRRFLCRECGKRFTQKFTLENHLRKHKGLPPRHRCTQCSRRFDRMSVLKVHMKKDHNLNLITKKMFYNRMPEMPSHEITKIIKADAQGKFDIYKVGR